MKRRKLETSDEKPIVTRGAKKGEIRNPTGKGGWQPGVSGNPDGRPRGAENKVQLSNVYDAWRQGLSLPLLYCFLSFRVPEQLCPHGDRSKLTEKHDAEIRQYMFKGYFAALDFVRKTAGTLLAEEIERDIESIVMASRAARSKASDKVIDFPEKRKVKL